MLIWLRDLIFGKTNTESKPAVVESQITDAVTSASPKKRVTKKTAVKKTATKKKTISTKKKPVVKRKR